MMWGMASQKRLVTSATAAARLKVHRRQVLRYVAAGELTPALQLAGRNGAYLFDPDDIEALAAARRAAGRRAALAKVERSA